MPGWDCRDGAEFQGTLSGWDLPHSAKTLQSGLPGYWTRAQGQASLQSSKLWKQRTAVEGGGASGLGPWSEDMVMLQFFCSTLLLTSYGMIVCNVLYKHDLSTWKGFRG